VQFNDVLVAGWCKERVGASDEEKKFLMGMVTADRNKILTLTHKIISLSQNLASKKIDRSHYLVVIEAL
jgi:hypothetical protein